MKVQFWKGMAFKCLSNGYGLETASAMAGIKMDRGLGTRRWLLGTGMFIEEYFRGWVLTETRIWTFLLHLAFLRLIA